MTATANLSRGKHLPVANAASVSLQPSTTVAAAATTTGTATTTATATTTPSRSNERDDDGTSSHSVLLVPSWTVRDAARSLIQQRQAMMPLSVAQKLNTTVTSSTTTAIAMFRAPVTSSSLWDVESKIDAVRSTKLMMVRAAFDAAAKACLRALQRPSPSDHQAARSVLVNTDLPPAMRQWQVLQQIKVLSLERARDNKEHAKRKGNHNPKETTSSTTLSSSSLPPLPSTTTSNFATTRATPVSSTTKSATISSLEGLSKEGQAPSAALSTSPPAPPIVADTTKSALPATVPSSSTLTSAPVAPKFTRNTPASSAAALDFRFTSSRAILCAAGNIAFEALTPAPNSESSSSSSSTPHNSRSTSLDVLSVPQNPNYNNTSKSGTNGNTNDADGAADTVTSSTTTTTTAVNMGAVVVEAQTLAQRCIAVVENAVRRSQLRHAHRQDNARAAKAAEAGRLYRGAGRDPQDGESNMLSFVHIPNPYAWKERDRDKANSDDPDHDDDDDEQPEDIAADEGSAASSSELRSVPDHIPYHPDPDALTETWQSHCLPRFRAVLAKGAGHAVYHDVQWSSRHGRLADLLRSMTSSSTKATTDGTNTNSNLQESNFGPHLIVTTLPEVVRYTQEFHEANTYRRLVMNNDTKALRSLHYHGSKKHRRWLRQQYFGHATGLPDAPFHVLVVSYTHFLQDYLHFCQVPFQCCILDEGLAWMATAQGDPNSAIGHLWDTGIFSANDKHIGLAGTSFGTVEWDFGKDEPLTEQMIKEAWVGLTARHRIMTAACLAIPQRQSMELVPVSGLVSFLAPHFAGVSREEWDRSRIASDVASMRHFRHLVARSFVVHHAPDGNENHIDTIRRNSITSHDRVEDEDNNNSDNENGKQGDSGRHHRHHHGSRKDMVRLAMLALAGQLPAPDRSDEPEVPHWISEDEFVSSGKIAFSRRTSLMWLGLADRSWLRYELGQAKLQHILDAMKISNHHGHYCEEITTASSTTTTGSTGQVAGTMAYRLAICCGRHFGSEQGLRQHISALHAPPGTWLCRTCGSDCITSQARTHHERSCGQPLSGVGSDAGGTVGATPTVGQGAGAKGGVGKKKPGRPGASQHGTHAAEEKDPDGSFRVPGYRGVFINKAGKHFVKIDGKRLTESEGSDVVIFFDNVDDAARKHDEAATKQKKKNQKLELNFKADGSRIIYEDITPASTSGLGGSAANVVPALSVINIKDLPPHIKPLLRDPRQTSRTGGNSKRHVYAYRGVCRQARKGHDRWQSQISFMGVNHYLGTFDSEWDAAAIYAWAHLILYGEEATLQAQREGEEAAAAYEQEKRDIAAGKIPEPPAKPEKKKKPKSTKKADEKEAVASSVAKPVTSTSSADGAEKSVETKKRKATSKEKAGAEKKAKTIAKVPKLEKEALGPTLSKGVAKAPILAPREMLDGIPDAELIALVGQKILARREAGYTAATLSTSFSASSEMVRPCLPWSPSVSEAPVAGAMLIGLSPIAFDWDLQEFLEANPLHPDQDSMTAIQLLAVEYDEDGTNENFKSALQGYVTILGQASQRTQRLYEALGLGSIPVGGAVGRLDCHVGGVPGVCSESAACIRFSPSNDSDFHICSMSNVDVVTINGSVLQPEQGSIPLHDQDICSIGARVFVFLLPDGSG